MQVRVNLQEGQELFLLKTKDNPVNRIRNTVLIRSVGDKATYQMQLTFKVQYFLLLLYLGGFIMRAVITGATGGIGGATAEALGRAGYEVIITGIDIEAGKKVIDKLESQGIKVHFYACDATNEEQVNETFAKIGEEFGSLDLLVNNVGGLGGRQRVSEMETGFMRKVMALNFDSVFFNTRAALPLLKKGKDASIINFSTIAVTSGAGIGASIYAASKGAVQSYTRALAKDLAEFASAQHGFSRHHRHCLPRCD